MNKKAEELNLQNTHFVTPHGLDEQEHYTTAYELALITRYALDNKKFNTIVNTKTTTIYINNTPRTINNTNELLGNLNGVDGVKTGFTNNAGRCLVTSTTRNGHRIICVVLGADTKKIRTTDSVKLIEYAFKNFEYVNVKDKIQEEFETWKEQQAKEICYLKAVNQNATYELDNIPITNAPINKNEVKDITVEIEYEKQLQAPVQTKTLIGTIYVKNEDQIICSSNILLQNTISKKTVLDYLQDMFFNYSNYLLQAMN